MAQRSIRPRPMPPRRQLYPNGWPRTMQAALYYNRKNRLERYAANNVPVNTTAPTISGMATEGEQLTVSDDGTWSGNPSPTFTYQWLRDGTDISGATASTYTLVTEDVGTMISCRVTGTNKFGSSSAVSNELGPVASP